MGQTVLEGRGGELVEEQEKGGGGRGERGLSTAVINHGNC